ncbi:helical backbone metal receptor [Streptomyces sp. 4.24]|uniref:helical backbone metal receptor n=1 Tax=Streptomyces tritrimontium TaxID=3406573 RepID=UPI003BB5879B
MRTPERIVSLVPSLTEAVAVSAPGALVGVTDWCTHPAALGDAARVGGTKNPDVRAIVELRPDLVIANEEENRAPDLAALRAAGLDVLVTEVRDLPQALSELERVLVGALGLERPGWLADAGAAWARVEPLPPALAFVPVWRRPWMVLGRDTFAGDLLARLGVRNAYAGHAERYPRIGAAELAASGCDLVVLPDEPYRFTAGDGPEAFPGIPAALVSGRHLTWYGPSLAEAPEVLARALRAAGPTP